ncbi:hypothetical protein Tco_0574984 [Tanacetum coccineum]
MTLNFPSTKGEEIPILKFDPSIRGTLNGTTCPYPSWDDVQMELSIVNFHSFDASWRRTRSRCHSGEQFFLELNRYLEQIRSRGLEILRVDSLRDHPLIKYGFNILERLTHVDIANSSNLVVTKNKLMRTIAEKEDDEVFLVLRWNLEEIHVTWAHLEKKQTRLRTYTKIHQEVLYSERRDGVTSIKQRCRGLSGEGV